MQCNQAQINQQIADFEWLHAHPELPYQEFETTAYIRQSLAEMGVEVLPYGMKTGLVAQLTGTKSCPAGATPIVSLRADIDALPVQEECDLSYRSQNEGKMHACGHDFHAAVLLCVARLLKANIDQFCGTVRFMFQPAEEASMGAADVLCTPAMEGVGAVFALHTSPLYPAGVIGLREGAVTASVNRFEINLTGVGCHAAYPENSVDVIVMGASIVSALQSVVSRNVAPLSPALLSITHFEAGKTWNVLPKTAYLEGTVRTLSKADQTLIPQRMRALIEGIAQSYGGSAEFLWHQGPPATDNDPAWTAFAGQIAQEQGLEVALDPPSMLGEDFSCYQELAKGVYIHAGIGLTEPNHHPKFMVDEASLAPAADYFATLTAAALAKLAAE
ncbi:MAG: amidohydrolase [Faecalibacterium sp.]